MGRTLLIVDDSATTRAFIRRAVGMAGIATAAVHEAADGAAGLKVMESTPIDLVVADLHMPVMDGVEMVKRMRADATLKAIPVLVVSADPNADRLAELKSVGISGCVHKPFTPEMFRGAIGQIWGGDHA